MEPWNRSLYCQTIRREQSHREAHLQGKTQARLGLADKSAMPLFAMISRLTPQKGFDLVENIFDQLMERDVQLVLLGSGEPRYEDFFRAAAARFPEKFAVRTGFDEPLAHQIEAGADLFLMPSLYEPCGLNQMFSLKYGTIPIVRAVGGLKDTVHHYDAAPGNRHGLCFDRYEPNALCSTPSIKAWGFSQQERSWTALSASRHGNGFFLGPLGEALRRFVPATCELREVTK